ncbi:MAG: Glutamyl-tRNA synthetase [Rhodanobacteraceae bacterium]|nr:MAG: Glutamyl-tRNA synthetase [Rhodanobacteraceae bacterium]
MSFRTRFAPSPTGFLHIGGARTALYGWLEARHRGGQFILRIEDTDRERSTDAAVQAIIDGMHWLGLDPDEGPLYQTQRMQRYREIAQQLHDAGKAYWAYESKEELDVMREAMKARGEKPRYDGRARDSNLPYRDDPNRVLRFRNPQSGSIVFDDKIKGRVEWANAELDDFVMLRSDGFPTYNFAVVVDDIDMGITEVIRGDDHVNNTPRQINLYQALGAPVPTFAHLPMILGPDGQKLSKRHGAVGVMQYREDGYLPHALLNYLVRLGWSHGDQEIFSIKEMIELFDIADVNHSAARFDFAKLGWLNQHYLKEGDPRELGQELAWHLERLGLDVSKGPKPEEVVLALRERVQTLKAMAEQARIWYAPIAAWDDKAVAKHLQADGAADVLRAMHAKLAALPAWKPADIHALVAEVATERGIGMGKVAQPLRVAMTGTAVSPSIEDTVYLAGRDAALKRIDDAIARASDLHPPSLAKGE